MAIMVDDDYIKGYMRGTLDERERIYQLLKNYWQRGCIAYRFIDEIMLEIRTCENSDFPDDFYYEKILKEIETDE